MTLVIEDGTGKSTAESYASQAEYTAYWTIEGKEDAYDFDVSEIEAALVAATRDIERRFYGLWVGQRTTKAQALSWPRLASDADGFDWTGQIPPALKTAVIETAWLNLSGQDLRAVQATQNIKSQKIQAGSVVVEKVFANPDTKETQSEEIEKILAPILRSGGTSVELRRV